MAGKTSNFNTQTAPVRCTVIAAERMDDRGDRDMVRRILARWIAQRIAQSQKLGVR